CSGRRDLRAGGHGRAARHPPGLERPAPRQPVAHEVELGPGDYLRWDGATPHDGEVIGDEPLRVFIVRIKSRD
ncbi:MAG: hypothetical protein ABIQ58_03780, partial [Candidatus Limnocylindrales bacterium]